MNKFKIVYEIARWEFFRWFKIKDQILTILISIGISFAIWGGKSILDKTEKEPVKIFILNSCILPFSIPEESRFVVKNAGFDSLQILEKSVSSREIDGLLIIKSIDEAELLVYKQPIWENELEQLLTKSRMQSKIRSIGVSTEKITDALNSFEIKIKYDHSGIKPTSLSEKIAGGIIIGLMLIGIFISFAYQFVAITGEKQLRVTEQIISAVTPQQWIDGKILGISAYAFAAVFTLVISVLIFIGISYIFGQRLEVPVEISNPMVLILLVLYGVGGLLIWNTFFAAISATINDPNTSAKSSLMMIPIILTIGVGFFAIKNPDSTIMKVFSIIPLTSSSALSSRLVLTEVLLWEILTSFVFLVIGIWMMRIAARKIFHLGILMYGKEPKLKEMIRWIRES